MQFYGKNGFIGSKRVSLYAHNNYAQLCNEYTIYHPRITICQQYFFFIEFKSTFI